MDTLKPNMYVRTKKGIAKIIDRILEPNHYYFKMWVTDRFLEINYDTEYISEVDVLKASHNIIDLIEEGDYVNGVEVINVDDEWITMSDTQVPILKSIANGLIKTILTKEQFKSMSYKLED